MYLSEAEDHLEMASALPHDLADSSRYCPLTPVEPATLVLGRNVADPTSTGNEHGAGCH